MSTFYNVGSADITDGLVDYEISSGQDYFILLSAPSNANIQIRLNENTAPLIPIKEHWQFKSADVKKIFITSDAIAGEQIKWGQADGNLEITTNPTINAIDTISQMGVTFAEQMDKIVNPYHIPTILTGSSSVQLDTIQLNTALDCDKIRIIFILDSDVPSAWAYMNATLDAKTIFKIARVDYGTSTQELTIENVRGQTLIINSTSGGGFCSYYLEKYIKK